MAWSVDARIPVWLGSLDAVREGDALLLEGSAPPPGCAAEQFNLSPSHAPGCTCCLARGSAAVALDRLFQRRVRGEVAFFRRVVAVTATPEGDLAVWSALRNDPLISARYRPDGMS